jgi:sugar O-acyltransferase (sialic acid O-acetyltransferase NeuD family)
MYYILGGGGHAKVVIEALMASRNMSNDFIRILDDHLTLGTKVAGCEVVGRFGELVKMRKPGDAFHVAIGDNQVRLREIELAIEKGFHALSIVHPKAMMSPSSAYGPGSFFAAGCVVGPEARFGTGCIVNHNASVDHDCRLGDAVHICPGAHLAGGVRLGDMCTIGTGASIIPYIDLADSTKVGAGAAVINDQLVHGKTLVGVPARQLGVYQC